MRISNVIRTIFGAGLVVASLDAQVIRTNSGFYKQTVARNDDGSSEATPLGFSINFFGKTRDVVYVNNNGNLTFDAPLPTYTPFGLQKTSREIIAPFFADVDTRGPKSALVSFGQDIVNGRKAFAANYVDVGYFRAHDEKFNRFQVIVIDRSDTGAGNFTIEFNYENISWETGDASGGVNGYGGVPASVGWSNGTADPGTSFELPGSMISGAFLNSGPRALVRAHLNTSQVGRMLFQARDGVISPGLTVQGGPLLPDGTVGEPYSFQFTAAGIDGTPQWELVPDLNMAPGLRFANGQISGLPTTPGTYGFTVSATSNVEGAPVTVYTRGAVTIGVAKLTIKTGCPVPQATIGQLYSTAFSATGPGAVAWSLGDRNSLPAGLLLSPSGVLSGVPSVSGNFSFLVRVSSTDGLGTLPAEKACTLIVNPAAVRLSSGCTMPNATAGVPYSQTLIPEGGVGPYRFDLIGRLPSGLGLSADGRIAGLPQFAGTEAFQIQITDSRANATRQSCTLAVGDPGLNISTACPLPRATTGVAYSAALTATGGVGPYTWSVAGGTLPAGLSFTSVDRISGTPMSAGPYTFRLLATDAEGRQSGTACSLPVVYGPLGIAGCPLPEATVGDSYRAVLTPAGGSEPFTWSSTGVLPPGLQMTLNGVIEGRLTAAGDFQFGVSLGDRSSAVVSQPCSLKVKPLALRVSNAGPATAGGKIGESYSTRFTAAGGVPPYRFEFFGTLPEGLEGAADGTLTGTPRKAGTTSFGVRVIDARGTIAESASSIEIGLPSLPGLTLSTQSEIVAPASADVKIGLALDRVYTLPITGQLVLTLSPDTQNQSANANQPDPHVRFGNGQLTSSFQIAPGAKSVSVPLMSTGTVATTMTISVRDIRAGGIPLTAAVTPQVLRVRAVPPVINSACFVKSDFGIQITLLGSSTTRELARGEVAAPQITRNTDLSDVATDYFAGDGSIRYGGAFSLQFAADPALKDSVGPFNVRLSNTAGWSTAVTAQACK